MTRVLSAGQILDGRYEILAPLAEGGMGAVFRARRTLLGDEVAIKIIRADQAGPGARERFMRESRACARLRHPNIVSILDFNVDAADRPYLVMELLGGPSVKEEIAARGRLSLEEVQSIVPPICAALQLAHGRGIVHRDLKPANIVAHDFAPGDRVYKLVDFGLANLRESADETRLTAAHQFLGTVAYASPEQMSGATVDARSDVYSLGAVIFEMLTGSVPFPGSDPFAVVTAHLTKPAPAATSIRADLPPWVDPVLARALAKNPDHRWQQIADLGSAIASGGERATSTAVGAPRSLLAAYDIGERVGPGRLGSEVFRGTHRALGHPVAIRVLRRAPDRHWDAVRGRFLREAQTMQVTHPSIIQVRDYGEDDDLVYVVTDYIDGPSLRELITTAGALEWPRLRPLLAQLVDAVRTLHKRKGLLCGLTPDIVRVTADEDGERLLISSAGIWQAQDLLATLHEQTLRGGMLADPELCYVAPELLIGRTADARSDVFTIAVLAYELATATLPYNGASMPALLGSMLAGRPADPREAQPTLPDRAAQALIEALRPAPEERFASVRDFGAALL